MTSFLLNLNSLINIQHINIQHIYAAEASFGKGLNLKCVQHAHSHTHSLRMTHQYTHTSQLKSLLRPGHALTGFGSLPFFFSSTVCPDSTVFQQALTHTLHLLICDPANSCKIMRSERAAQTNTASFRSVA